MDNKQRKELAIQIIIESLDKHVREYVTRYPEIAKEMAFIGLAIQHAGLTLKYGNHKKHARHMTDEAVAFMDQAIAECKHPATKSMIQAAQQMLRDTIKNIDDLPDDLSDQSPPRSSRPGF